MLYDGPYLQHHGIKGQRWGVRRFQNEDGSLTPQGIEHYRKLDNKWASKNHDKLMAKTKKKVDRDMGKYLKQLEKEPGFTTSRGQISKTAINKYNRKLAELMNTKVTDIRSPSGKVVKFVAKRGEIGVYMALADQGYDIDKVKNGLWSGGRVAYRSNKLNTINI